MLELNERIEAVEDLLQAGPVAIQALRALEPPMVSAIQADANWTEILQDMAALLPQEAARLEAEARATEVARNRVSAAEVRREAEVRDKLVAQAARARAWAAEMSGGGLALLRHRAGARRGSRMRVIQRSMPVIWPGRGGRKPRVRLGTAPSRPHVSSWKKSRSWKLSRPIL